MPHGSRRSSLMRLAAPAKPGLAKSEQIILFRVSGQLFAVSSASVQEVRSVDSLSGAAEEINAPGRRKVCHVLRRGDRTWHTFRSPGALISSAARDKQK